MQGDDVDGAVIPGQVAVQQGAVMAACDSFELTVQGKGGHGSTPHLTVDPIVGACLPHSLTRISKAAWRYCCHRQGDSTHTDCNNEHES